MRLMNRFLEENRKVVDDRITTPYLLHELTAHAEHHTPEMLSLAACKDSFERCPLSARIARGTDTVHDDLLLQLCLLVLPL